LLLQRVCALVLTSVALTACAGEKDIVHGLKEWEANEIIVVLDSKGIPADKVLEPGRVVTWAVVVPASSAPDALRLLVANHLPREQPNIMSKVYPAGGGGLIPTKSEEKAKMLMAIQGEVERKLQQLPGIVQVHVSIVQPDKDVVRDLDQPAPMPMASVAMVFNPVDDRGTSSVTIDDVKMLVAASVEDLKPANVQVVMKRNAPTAIIDPAAPEAGQAVGPVTTKPVFGVKVADAKSAERIQLVLAALGLAAVLGLLLGVVWSASRGRSS
jgi:type III secretion protein J